MTTLITAVTISVNPPELSTIQSSGIPDSTQTKDITITNNGWGGLKVFYQQGNAAPQTISNCISPGTTTSVRISYTLAKGQTTTQISLFVFDYWAVIGGNICDTKSSNDYSIAKSNAYSVKQLNYSLVTTSGCQYGQPICDDSHNCINNECILKPGCQYNNPACDSSHDCTNNVCILKPGCLYNNPPCDSRHDCTNNACILKPGCDYDNPPCSTGFICQQNACIAVLTQEETFALQSKLNKVQTDLEVTGTKVAKLIGILDELQDSAGLSYWKNIQVTINEVKSKETETSSIILANALKQNVKQKLSELNNDFQQKLITKLGGTPHLTQIKQETPTPTSRPTPISTIQPTIVPPQTIVTSQPTQTPSPTQSISPPVGITATSIKNLLNRIPGINSIANGVSVGFFVGSRTFVVSKSGDISVIEQQPGNTDFDIVFNTEETFQTIASAPDICSAFKTNSKTGAVQGNLYISQLEAVSKGLKVLNDCIS